MAASWSERIGHPKKAAFLAAFEVCATIRGAARAAEISPGTHYEWLGSDPVYAELFAEAKEASIEMLEEEARRRAMQGTERLKFHEGQAVRDPRTITAEKPQGDPYIEREFSDTLAIFLLKAARPDKYRERSDVNHSGEVGVKVRRIILEDDANFPPPKVDG